jgi:hypothetical protein
MFRLSLLAVALLPLSAAASTNFQTQLGAARLTILKAAGANSEGFQTLSRQERDVLVDLLRDGDEPMKIAALRSLRSYVNQTSSIRRVVLRTYLNSQEPVTVRIQAAKTLSYVSQYREVYDALLRGGQRYTDTALRVISLKALYIRAMSDSSMRRALVQIAQRDNEKEVRLAAIWGLFQASGDNRVRDALWTMAQRDSDLDIRVESLRSLYLGMNHSRLHSEIERLAARTSEETDVRVAAVLLLSRIQSSRTRSLLQRLAQRDADGEIREAAVLAMRPTDERIREYFHLVQRNQNGSYIDPLDLE